MPREVWRRPIKSDSIAVGGDEEGGREGDGATSSLSVGAGIDTGIVAAVDEAIDVDGAIDEVGIGCDVEVDAAVDAAESPLEVTIRRDGGNLDGDGDEDVFFSGDAGTTFIEAGDVVVAFVTLETTIPFDVRNLIGLEGEVRGGGR